MESTKLLSIVEEHERTERVFAGSCLAVWTAVSEAEPELAAELLLLFSTVPAAALWITSLLPDVGASPARLVAQGRAEDVLSRIRQTMHGFVA